MTERSTARQVAALPIRRRNDGCIEVLLVTSRRTRRWLIPKGWPSKDLPDHEMAAIEADEEGGVVGTIAREPLGSYSYVKERRTGDVPVEVLVYVLSVQRERRQWRESKVRERRWFSADKAAELVLEPELAELILTLAA